jgi:hypothetical protein
MKHALVLCLILIACGKSQEEKAREEAERDERARIAREGSSATSSTSTPTPTEAAKPAPTEAAKPAGSGSGSAAAKEPQAEPTTPAEIDKARKQAMIDNRDQDVIKYCGMSNLGDKTDPQILLGCTLAACRQKDEAKAREWSKPLGNAGVQKEFLQQAKKICLASQVGI